jgi:hypothetical protein
MLVDKRAIFLHSLIAGVSFGLKPNTTVVPLIYVYVTLRTISCLKKSGRNSTSKSSDTEKTKSKRDKEMPPEKSQEGRAADAALKNLERARMTQQETYLQRAADTARMKSDVPK